MRVISRAERLFGVGEYSALFHGDRALVPWSQQPKRKGDPQLDEVRMLLRQPVYLVEVDPRLLLATQPFVVGHHFRHYFEDAGNYSSLAITSADQDSELNRFPVVEPDGQGRYIIRSGHHRSAVALVAGRMLKCRMVGALRDCSSVAVTPTLSLTLSNGHSRAKTYSSESHQLQRHTFFDSVTAVELELKQRGADSAWLKTLRDRLERDINRFHSGKAQLQRSDQREENV